MNLLVTELDLSAQISSVTGWAARPATRSSIYTVDWYVKNEACWRPLQAKLAVAESAWA
jgi:hypothetical protein